MGYITSARIRGARRRSRWNLILIPCYAVPWLLLVFASMVGLSNIYAARHPESAFRVPPDTVGGLMMAVGSLVAWLGPAMIAGNVLVSVVPAARLALDREGAQVAGTSREAANRGLLKLSSYLTPAGVVLALLGAMLSW